MIPQGSILSPLLFLLYINDLALCTILFKLLFADNIALVTSNRDINELFDCINNVFQKLCATIFVKTNYHYILKKTNNC